MAMVDLGPPLQLAVTVVTRPSGEIVDIGLSILLRKVAAPALISSPARGQTGTAPACHSRGTTMTRRWPAVAQRGDGGSASTPGPTADGQGGYALAGLLPGAPSTGTMVLTLSCGAGRMSTGRPATAT